MLADPNVKPPGAASVEASVLDAVAPKVNPPAPAATFGLGASSALVAVALAGVELEKLKPPPVGASVEAEALSPNLNPEFADSPSVLVVVLSPNANPPAVADASPDAALGAPLGASSFFSFTDSLVVALPNVKEPAEEPLSSFTGSLVVVLPNVKPPAGASCLSFTGSSEVVLPNVKPPAGASFCSFTDSSEAVLPNAKPPAGASFFTFTDSSELVLPNVKPPAGASAALASLVDTVETELLPPPRVNPPPGTEVRAGVAGAVVLAEVAVPAAGFFISQHGHTISVFAFITEQPGHRHAPSLGLNLSSRLPQPAVAGGLVSAGAVFALEVA